MFNDREFMDRLHNDVLDWKKERCTIMEQYLNDLKELENKYKDLGVQLDKLSEDD